jgi:hypothetical protein
VFDWEVPVFDWEVPVFDWEVPVFGREVPVFDGEVPSRSEDRLVVESAKIASLRVAQSGIAGAAQGRQPATAALRDAQGRATPPRGLGWVMKKCPRRGKAPVQPIQLRRGVLHEVAV